MKKVKLTQGKYSLVDDEDFETLNKHAWRTKKDWAGNSYAFRTSSLNGKGFSIYMHRLIVGVSTGQEVDHIDGDGLNNQKKNLRIVTHRENMMNRRQRTVSKTSNNLGVIKRKNTFIAQIKILGKNKYLGSFRTEEEALKARIVAEKSLGVERLVSIT